MNNAFSTTIVRQRPWWRSVVETFFGVSKRELIQRMNALEGSNLELARELNDGREKSRMLTDELQKYFNEHVKIRSAVLVISRSGNRQDGPKVRRLIKIAADAIADIS